MTKALLLAILLVAPLALAGTEEDRYSAFEDATGFHTQKKMARTIDGSLYYTYVEPTNVSNLTDVVVVHRLADGTEVELPSVHAARGGLARPTLVLDAAGALHLAWTEHAAEDREVFAAVYRDGAWNDITQLSGGIGYSGFPSLGATPDGAVHAAWYGYDGEFYQTYYREWKDGRWTNATELSSGPLDANNPSLVTDRFGGVHVAWYKDEGKRTSVWYAHRAPNGTWDAPRRLPTGNVDALNVALAIDANDTVHVVWDERANDITTVMHASLDGPATALGPGEYPAIARWKQGVIVAWAAPNGTLMGWTGGAALPLLDAPHARNPSLRGASFLEPVRDLDIMWSEEDGAHGYEIRHALIPWNCDALPPARCAPLDAPALVPLGEPGVALLALLLGAFRRSGHKR